jgi:hypothetical protein
MYQPSLPYNYIPRYPYVVQIRRLLPPKEILWRLSWPYVFTLVLASLMLLFTLIIFALEIASLATDSSNQLSNTASTGAGIWCSIFFIIAIVFMYLLGKLIITFKVSNSYLFIFSSCLS